jgi:hypothetical protein
VATGSGAEGRATMPSVGGQAPDTRAAEVLAGGDIEHHPWPPGRAPGDRS